MKWLIERLMRSDWKRVYALTVVYGYMYDIIIWPCFFWLNTFLTEVFTRHCTAEMLRIGGCGFQFSAPPLVPWEQLVAATANLAVIGAVQFARDRKEMAKSESTV